MKNDLKVKVADWLKKEGYPLEMKVADIFRRNGFGVDQSSYFIDPETGKMREMDVIATAIDKYTSNINISWVIECKSSKKYPWILFTSKHAAEGYNDLFTCCLNSSFTRKIFLEKKWCPKLNIPWIKKNQE